MKIANCPMCGGFVRGESIGWKCTNCQGFIDMHGKFHEHEEKPFMPPMTNADRIRAMSDEELANLLNNYSNNGGWVTETGRQICYERIIEFLQQPAEGE